MNLPFKSVKKTLHYGSRLRPGRDWFVLLCFFLAAIAVSLAYNLFTFSQVTKGQKIGNATVAQPAEIQLNQVKSLFSDRDAERQRYSSDYRFVDPSL